MRRHSLQPSWPCAGTIEQHQCNSINNTNLTHAQHTDALVQHYPCHLPNALCVYAALGHQHSCSLCTATGCSSVRRRPRAYPIQEVREQVRCPVMPQGSDVFVCYGDREDAKKSKKKKKGSKCCCCRPTRLCGLHKVTWILLPNHFFLVRYAISTIPPLLLLPLLLHQAGLQ